MRQAALAATALSLALAAGGVHAQPAQNGPQNPAVHTDNSNNSNGPVAGANSFTMAEAQSRITDKGYTRVSSLKKDNDGIWRGMATKDGQRVPVSLDYQGNVNTN